MDGVKRAKTKSRWRKPNERYPNKGDREWLNKHREASGWRNGARVYPR